MLTWSEAVISDELTPVIIIAAAIFWTKADEGLTVAEAFTSLSLISIASGPLIHILVSIMTLSGAIGSFVRLQAFLELEERADPREFSQSSGKSSLSFVPAGGSAAGLSPNSSTIIELPSLPASARQAGPPNSSELPTVTIERATFTAGEDVEVLSDISVNFRQGTVSMIVGRVGCGKSSLLKAITGELPMKVGSISTSTSSIAYCDQTPWLQNISIRDNITGQTPLDDIWLASVIRSCALDEDISMFPQGDMAIVGSGGVALSGGQKLRVVSENFLRRKRIS